MNEFEFKIDYLMADGSRAISKAAKEVIGNMFERLMCYYHIKKTQKFILS